jgi:tetratricopeptide (TPR) repeat protein
MKQTLVILLFLAGCSTPKTAEVEVEGVPSVVGLDGRKFFPEISASALARLDSNFTVAERNFRDDPSEDNFIWYGRRAAYRYNYDQSIEIFTDGLERYPNSYRLLRHRGHRYISIRDFDRAIADLERAVQLLPDSLEIEPDGIPNKLNTPLSTTQFNAWYHLALAYYLKGDYERAERAYLKCMDVSNNDDLLTATGDWLYMTYRRQGKSDEASALLDRFDENMVVIENDSYLKRIMMYKGKILPEQLLIVDPETDDPELAIATQGYGVGNWYLYNGDTTRAIDILKKVTDGKHFTAFGFIAAEVDLMRLR